VAELELTAEQRARLDQAQADRSGLIAFRTWSP
jgi:hypothetical protein